jgi:hypothetical protein
VNRHESFRLALGFLVEHQVEGNARLHDAHLEPVRAKVNAHDAKCARHGGEQRDGNENEQRETHGSFRFEKQIAIVSAFEKTRVSFAALRVVQVTK